jgi:protein TonB
MSLSCWTMGHSLTVRTRIALLGTLLLQACSQSPRAPEVSQPAPPPLQVAPAPVEPTPSAPLRTSMARTAEQYRQHAAQHVYAQHASQLFSGPMPPLLQAVGVLAVEIGSQGEVRRLTWLRPPAHVPAVMHQIEQLVHQAAPYPAPLHLGGVTYTDTWLWHHSGRFQLHTLSEGQLGVLEATTTLEPKRRATRRTATSTAPALTAKCAHVAPNYC